MMEERVTRIEKEFARREGSGAWRFPLDPQRISLYLYRKLLPELSPEEIDRVPGRGGPMITHIDFAKVRRSLEKILRMATR